jgi:hypothetical protein
MPTDCSDRAVIEAHVVNRRARRGRPLVTPISASAITLFGGCHSRMMPTYE